MTLTTTWHASKTQQTPSTQFASTTRWTPPTQQTTTKVLIIDIHLFIDPTSTLRPKILTKPRFLTCRPLRIKPMGYSYNLFNF